MLYLRQCTVQLRIESSLPIYLPVHLRAIPQALPVFPSMRYYGWGDEGCLLRGQTEFDGI